MNVLYCDLCGNPIKPGEQWNLFCCPPNESKLDTEESYYAFINKVKKEIKEMCPTCHFLFEKIFEYRLQGVSKLTEECTELFNLPTNKDKKRGKEKETS